MGKLRFDANTPLYTSDARAWQIDELEDALAQLYKEHKPVVLFVHGRGKEPGKSLQGGQFTTGMAVHKIERGYDVKVLMFNWDSAFNGWNIFDREVPLSHTEQGAAAFGRVLDALARAEDAHGARSRPVLLIHSMGSVVVQEAILNNRWPSKSNMFSSVLFSQPDADDVGHRDWLEPLSRTESTYVTLNKDDHVLLRSRDARPDGRKALGLGTTEPLAETAHYIDLSNMGSLGKKDDDHEVFGKGAMNDQLYVCEFFTQAICGAPITLDQRTNVEAIERGCIYRLKSRHEPSAQCLKVPVLPNA
jgi:esterase/lipase superfamily enzyme